MTVSAIPEAAVIIDRLIVATPSGPILERRRPGERAFANAHLLPLMRQSGSNYNPKAEPDVSVVVLADVGVVPAAADVAYETGRSLPDGSSVILGPLIGALLWIPIIGGIWALVKFG